MLDKPASFDPPEVVDLVLRWQRNRDERARDELVRRYMPSIKSAARWWGRKYQVNPDDADQEAALGFLRAIETHDPSKSSLESYTHIWARSKIGQARGAEVSLTIPSYAFNHTGKVTRANHKLRQRFGRPPTMEELAAETGLTVGAVETAFAARHLPRRLVSTSTPITNEDNSITIGDLLEAEEGERPDVLVEGASTVRAARAAIDAVVATFTPRHQLVFRTCFEEGRPLADAAEALGVIRQRAQQIHAQIASRLREALVDDPAALALLGREPAPTEEDDADGRLLNSKEVADLTGLDKAIVVDMMGRGTFPRSVARDRRGHRLWRESAVLKGRAQQESRPPVAAS